MVENPLGVIEDYAIEDAEQFGCAHPEAGFLERFPFCPFAHGFAELEHAARNRPFPEQRGVTALDQDDAPARDDQGAYSDQRLLRILSFCQNASRYFRLARLCVGLNPRGCDRPGEGCDSGLAPRDLLRKAATSVACQF